jgi:putative alpha-1,2-mannosidase
MNPASGEYVFGYPLIDNAVFQLPNKKKLQVKVTRRLNGKPAFITGVKLNGKTIPVLSVTHKQLMQGGVLEMVANE